MLVPRTRSDPARPTGASPAARPPRPGSNQEFGSNEPGVRADTVRPAPQRPRCFRAGPGPSGLPTMQDPLTTSRPSRGRLTYIDARSGANGAMLAAARAAACQMFKQGSGVIMFMTEARPDFTSQELWQSAPPTARSRTSPGTRPSSSVPLG